MILCTTVALGLAYLATLQAREALARLDRSITADLKTSTCHTPDAPAYQHRNPDHHPRNYPTL
jgi:Tfp pilus assembly protein PilF